MSKWDEWKKSQARPWHLLDPDRYVQDPDLAKQRLSICEGCEFFQVTKTCEKCGCFMPLKTKLAIAECPIGKWSREDGGDDKQ